MVAHRLWEVVVSCVLADREDFWWLDDLNQVTTMSLIYLIEASRLLVSQS